MQAGAGAKSAAECNVADDDCYNPPSGFGAVSAEPASGRWAGTATATATAAGQKTESDNEQDEDDDEPQA